ncbi:MAG TPA: hypothetical protein VFD58_23845 [Blastocatellia bacterium]|nr:hypothetical protein [Blastocatellia bacterium]
MSEESLQAYLDGEQAADAGMVFAHLAECARCAALAREAEQELAALNDALDDELPAVIPTTRLRARIESAVAESSTPQYTLASLFRHVGQRRAAWIAASVLAVACVIGWFAFVTRSATIPRPARQHEVRGGLPAPSVTPGPQTPLPMPRAFERDREVAQQPATHRPRRRVHQQASGNNPDEAEVVTQFFPLREGEDPASLESVRLVRVELPGSALVEVGFPVDRETASEPVKADVLLGQDGLARAIRFVR